MSLGNFVHRRTEPGRLFRDVARNHRGDGGEGAHDERYDIGLGKRGATREEPRDQSSQGKRNPGQGKVHDGRVHPPQPGRAFFILRGVCQCLGIGTIYRRSTGRRLEPWK